MIATRERRKPGELHDDYNASCRTVAAGVRATIGDLSTENCYAKIHRNSDDEILYAGADAGVSSYAWSHCALSNGAVYRGGTTSY
ncbi:hypothetical protein ACTMTJ_39450 [Phytohabitans sp. LJ34]|uniref:hypothetical protein n=1 Tax=Phytohabitans sp. LJ34 TaxID=3452217 RepID=UPI003F8912AA